MEYEKADALVENREAEVEKVCEKIEKDFTLIGATAIEDRLQDQVKPVLTHIRGSGIRLWLLTGDKIETAVNIGFSAGLITQSMQQHTIDKTTYSEISIQMIEIANNLHMYEDIESPETKKCLILSGESLTQIQNAKSNGLQTLLMEICD